MGWFGKNDGEIELDDDIVEAEESIVSTPPPPARSAALQRTPEAMGVRVEAMEAPIVAGEPTPSKPPASAYGIDDVVALMRELPSDNVEIVVRVVKKTLESVSIAIPTLIDDAQKREESLKASMSTLRAEIAGFEEQIMRRRAEIESLESAYEEVSTVKKRLTLSEQLAAGGNHPPRAATTPPAARSAPSQTAVPLRTRPPPPPPTSSSVPIVTGTAVSKPPPPPPPDRPKN